jgi:carboxylesterase
MTKIFTFSISCLLLVFSSCSDPTITDDLLDGSIVFDPSLYAPEDYLVSAKYPNPTPEDLEKHILIAVHGYSATTFEWEEFQDWSTDSNYRISSLLLDGHGRTYDAFKAAKWEDWNNAIIKEYNKLDSLGYKKISFVGSSTGCTLLLELVSSGFFNSKNPENIFFVDPNIVSSIKAQSMVGILGPMVVYIDTEPIDGEEKYWYRFRPYETINELNELMKKVRQDLEDGFKLPQGTNLKVFQSRYDPVASSTGSVLIYKGLKNADGSNIEVQIMESDIHVFTRLSLRNGVTDRQKANQLDAFTQIASRLN